MNFTPNKYAFTKSHYFIKLLNETNELLDKDLYTKIISQYELFNNMYEEIAKTYEINNSLSSVYLRDWFIDLNKSNPDFTVIPIKIKTNLDKDDAIHLCLLHKIIYDASKYDIQAYLFNKTCYRLGWFC